MIIVCGKKENATVAGKMMRRMMWRAISCVMGPRACVMWERVIGSVAINVHVET